MGLTLVEADLSLALEAGIKNPVDHEQGSLDAAHLSQCEGQLILARVRGELAKNLAGGDDPRCDRRHDAQDVGPVALDERFIDLTSDQRSHIGRRRVGREGIESFLREIPDTGGEPVAEQGAGGEHMIGEAARVGKMLANAAARVIHEQPVQDIGSLADRCRDHLGCERRILIGHMAVSLEARDVAIFRVDQIHRLALLGSKEELPVAGCRLPLSPEGGQYIERTQIYALMTAIRDAGRVYSFAGLETSGRIDLGGCAAGA